MKVFVRAAALAVAAAGMFGLIYYFSRDGAPVQAAVEKRPETVCVAEVTVGPIAEEVEVAGEVLPIAQVDLAPKVTGRLMSLSADQGDGVAKGEVVAVLGKDTFQAAFDQAAAAVEVARAELKSARAQRDNSERDCQRSRSLFDQGTVPLSTLDDAEAALKCADSAVEVAEAAVAQAEALLQAARIDLDECEITAPFDAVVAERFLDIGAYVQAGCPVVRLVSVDTVKVTAGISENYLPCLDAGKTATTVTLDALPGSVFPGTLYRLSPVLDKSTRTAEADVRIPNPGRRIKPGMYARVTLVARKKPSAVLVPNDAVLGREGAWFVFVERDGTAMRTPVELGLRSIHTSEVTSGLSAGCMVVTSSAGNLLDGARVTVREEPQP